MKKNRMRQQIIDLNSGKVYMNESMAESDLGVSRYFIRKSLKEQIPVGGSYMFAYYSYGMDIEDLKTFYMQRYDSKTVRSDKWQKLIRAVEHQPTLI
jgi:hypothetical protein